jgi:hypothetical protein
MKLELASGALRLARGQTLKMQDAAGSTICAREGTVWITEENSRRDVVLEGARFKEGDGAIGAGLGGIGPKNCWR